MKKIALLIVWVLSTVVLWFSTYASTNKYIPMINRMWVGLDTKFTENAEKQGITRYQMYQKFSLMINHIISWTKSENSKALLSALNQVIHEQVLDKGEVSVVKEEVKKTPTKVVAKTTQKWDIHNPASFKSLVNEFIEVKRVKRDLIGRGKTYETKWVRSYNFRTHKYWISKLTNDELQDMTLIYITNDKTWLLVESSLDDMVKSNATTTVSHRVSSSGGSSSHSSSTTSTNDHRTYINLQDAWYVAYNDNYKQYKQLDSDIVYYEDGFWWRDYYTPDNVYKPNRTLLNRYNAWWASISRYNNYIYFLWETTSLQPQQAVSKADNIFTEIAQQTQRLVNPWMNENQKIEAIYEWVQNNKVRFGKNYSLSEKDKVSQAFNVWLLNDGNCNGINDLYWMMLEMAGIKNIEYVWGELQWIGHLLLRINGRISDASNPWWVYDVPDWFVARY